jgi:hypothetical protein
MKLQEWQGLIDCSAGFILGGSLTLKVRFYVG